MDGTHFFQVLFSINALVWGLMSTYHWYKGGQVEIDVTSASDDIKKIVDAFNESAGHNRVAAYVTVAALWFSVWAGLIPLLAHLFPSK